MSTVIPFPNMARKPAGPALPPVRLCQEYSQPAKPTAMSLGAFDPHAWDVGDGVVDIRDTATGIELECQFPSFESEDVTFSLLGNVLTIRAEKKAKDKRWTGNGKFRERCHSRFSQRLTLPFAPNAASLASRFADGVLHLSVPRRG